jgi:hypothetical protein
MARAVQSEEGKAGSLQHRDETQGQIDGLPRAWVKAMAGDESPRTRYRA